MAKEKIGKINGVSRLDYYQCSYCGKPILKDELCHENIKTKKMKELEVKWKKESEIYFKENYDCS